MLALTHLPSPRMEQCQRTFVAHCSIDYAVAVHQHELYCRTLEQCGLEVRRLDSNLDSPDCTFIEDAAIVLDELAVLGSMGTESRRVEPGGILAELSRYRQVHRLESPAMLEGGDVLQINRTLLVGLSSRTNQQGIAALDSVVRHCGYQVHPVPVRGCLHLKTACTALPDGRLLINPDWVDPESLGDYGVVTVPQEEPWAANVLPVQGRVHLDARHVRTADMVQRLGFEVKPLEVSEFAKAEGGVTCLSIIFEP